MWRRLRSVFGWLGQHVDELSLIGIGLMFFLVASNTQTGWVYLLSGSLFGALLTAALASRRAMPAGDPGFRLRLPLAVESGTLFTAELLWSKGTTGYPGFWFPLAGQALRVRQQGREQALLAAGPGEATIAFEAEQRGVYPSLQAQLVCYGPLAWFPARRRVVVELLRPLVVLPRRLRVSAEELQRASGGQVLQQAESGQRIGNGDLRRLREYHVGDDVRFIHWASSARSGQLIVRELSEGGATRLDLVWGASQPDAPGAAEAFEWLLCWVYSYYSRAAALGWNVRLLGWNGSAWEAFAGPEALARARLESTPSPPPESDQGRRLDFWLGHYPGTQPHFEFWPSDFAGASGAPEPGGSRVLPGQEPA